MHPVSLQGDGLCHKYLYVMSRVYRKAEKHLRKAKNINKLYIAAFFSAAKIKLEEKTQAKNTRIHVFLKAINLEFIFFF